MATATVSDVKEVITTDLADSDITNSLDYAAEWNSAANTPADQTTTQTRNIERWAAVLNIRQYKEPAVEEDAVADVSNVYEGSELQRAKSELANWLSLAGEDPTSASSLLRDDNRYTTTS